MARQVFFSFQYKPDVWRTSQVRNIGAIDGNKPVTDNDWEEVIKGGDKAIKEWINDNLYYRKCTIVLIGENTANRKWINYEIEKSWNDGKGIFGIYIHNLKNSNGDQSDKGKNPFDYVTADKIRLSDKVKCYNPPYSTSTNVYDYIKENIADWVEKAIEARK